MVDPPTVAESRMRILIVDDDSSTRFVLRLILEREGYVVAEAGDGANALRMLETDPVPDVITADLMMPLMTGFELIQRLRSGARTLAIPIVVVTSDPDAAHKMSSSGVVDAVMSKPFTASDFAECIQQLTDRKFGGPSTAASVPAA